MLAVAAATAMVAVGGMAAIDVTRTTDWLTREFVQEPLAFMATQLSDDDGGPRLATELVRAGETIFSRLASAGVMDIEATKLLRTGSEFAAIRQLVPGARLTIARDDAGRLLGLDYLAPDMQRYRLKRDESGFTVETAREIPNVRIAIRSGDVAGSLFNAFREYTVPDEIQRQLVSVFSKQFDLHKAAREIERFAVAYEELTVDGAVFKLGRVLATELIREGKTYRAVWYADGRSGRYYTPEGASLDRAFITPVDFTQITSWFGVTRSMRWYREAEHKGVDYAAPTGTPVRAAGDGSVDFVGVQRGYGNVVVLRHTDPYTTLYAHLDRFAVDLQPGMRVRQGEVIGYVGRTGWATGPHLHYEFRKNGEPLNPKMERVTATQLADADAMERFRAYTTELTALLDRVSGIRIAYAN